MALTLDILPSSMGYCKDKIEFGDAAGDEGRRQATVEGGGRSQLGHWESEPNTSL